ncbi:MAG: glycosyltransferase [Verrucomicrobia bacterium]|nr:glycosyltransferase [Verrucomicrobiota bacterium]
MTPTDTHLVLMPTYNTGARLHAVVVEALRHWPAVLVVVDGSTDGSERPLLALAQATRALTVLVLPRNTGKGAAVLAGARAAVARGFTHALVMDADGQHPASSIAEFMHASQREPRAMILGRPIFPPNIPAARLHGRKLSIWLVYAETLGPGIADPLFGFRVLPLVPLLTVLGPRRGGRRYDFDSESAVRLCWAGVPSRNLPAPVRYFSRDEGGVSHFRYVRDNVTQTWLHIRLLVELIFWRWPAALGARRRSGRKAPPVAPSLVH